MQPLGVLDLLELRGFDRSAKAKLVRHQDSRYPAEELIRHGWLEAYQSYQSRPVFHECEQIVSFVGVEATRALFVGVYDVLEKDPAEGAPIPPGCPYLEWLDSEHRYLLAKVEGYEDLEERLVIEWGKATLSWHQWLVNKEVIELLPPGHRLAPFADYLDFTLTWDELRYLVQQMDAHRDWRSRLEAVAGIYLILDGLTGKQYVGSASGSGGIWSRWSEYARNGHGGNVILRDLVRADDESYPRNFLYSILQVLPKTLSRAEVLRWERRYKEKLGTQATGLNLN